VPFGLPGVPGGQKNLIMWLAHTLPVPGLRNPTCGPEEPQPRSVLPPGEVLRWETCDVVSPFQ
jgi:hypothetical protein